MQKRNAELKEILLRRFTKKRIKRALARAPHQPMGLVQLRREAIEEMGQAVRELREHWSKHITKNEKQVIPYILEWL